MLSTIPEKMSSNNSRLVRRPARGFLLEFIFGVIAGVTVSVWISSTIYFQQDFHSVATISKVNPPTLSVQNVLKEQPLLTKWKPKERLPGYKDPTITCLVTPNQQFVNPLVINATWGSRCDQLIFAGPRKLEQKELNFILPTYPGITPIYDSWEYVRSILTKLDLKKTDYLFVVDDMTYGIPDNIRYEFRGYSPGTESLFWGRLLSNSLLVTDLTCIPNAFVLSRKTFIELQQVLKNGKCSPVGTTGSEISACLKKELGLDCKEAIDFSGKLQIMKDPLQLLSIHDLPAHLISGKECCSVLPLAFLNVGRIVGVRTGQFSYHYFYDYFIRDTAVFGKEYMRPLNGIDAGVNKPQIGF